MLIDDSSDYKRGGVVGGFYWFSPPLGKGRKFSWLFGDFGRKIAGLNGDFSIPRFVGV